MTGDIDEKIALKMACKFIGLKGVDLAKEVTTASISKWTEGSWRLNLGYQSINAAIYKVVVYDFGVKRNILRMLVDRGAELIIVPAETPAREVLDMNPDGVFLSNGPGSAALHLCHRGYKTAIRNQYPHIWNLFRPSAFSFGKWRQNLKNEIWSSWSQSSC